MIGETISHYRILEKLAEGGMGLVYKAEDLKLGRLVALKFLPEASSGEAEALERFKREARAASALNHPNICTVYDIDALEGRPFIAMEFLEGETLKRRLTRGSEGRRSPLPIDELLDVSFQIADALDAAHRKAITHRDIKPGNIFIIQRSGGVQVKILDFGLAKLGEALAPQRPTASAASDRPFTEMPTATDDAEHLTRSGAAIGTVAYMSPEQARGENVDSRSDLFSFGAVLYEMATGHQAFAGSSTAITFDAILNKSPAPPLEVNPDLPPKLGETVERLLEKDRDLRYQTAADLRSDLKRLKRDSSHGQADHSSRETIVGSATPARPLSGDRHISSDTEIVATLVGRHRKSLLAASASLVGLLAVLGYLFRSPLPPPTVSGYTQLTNDGVHKFPVGTDGTRIYLREYGSGFSSPIAQMSVSGGTVAPVAAPSPGLQVVNVSPDGSKLLLVDQVGSTPEGPLWVMPVPGGSPLRLSDLVGQSGAWSPNGEQLVYGESENLYLANADGTGSRKLATLAGRGYYLAWSPDGSRISFTLEESKTGITSLWQISADGKDLQQKFPGWEPKDSKCCGVWTPRGTYFVFFSQGQIWAARERGSFLHKAGRKPVQLTAGTAWYNFPLPSTDGKALFALSGFARGELELFDVKTKGVTPYAGGISAQDLAFSKDKQWIAYVSFPEGTLWRSRVDGNEKLQLTTPPMEASLPQWSPDGSELVFYGFQQSKVPRIYLISANGGAPRELIPKDPGPQADPVWSPDGDSIAYAGLSSGSFNNQTAVRVLNIKTGQVTTLEDSEGLFSPRWSPDGRYIVALTGTSQGLMLYDFKTHKWSTLFTGTAAYPCWCSRSRYVYFLHHGSGTANPSVDRIAVPEGKLEHVVALQGFRTTGTYGYWFGLTPNDEPLLLKDTGAEEIVSMRWQEP